MATDSTRLYPNRSDAQLSWIYSGLALFTLFAGLIAALAVFANDLYFWRQSPLYISPYLFALAFVLGASHRVMGLMVIIAILPLSAGLGQQFNAYLGASLMTLPNQGLDLASGFFLGAIASYLVKAAIHRKTPQSILSELQCAVPWPIALVIVMVTCSTALAIARNIYQSATATSVKGVLFNLVHFRPIDWHADFMPISDWVAYALAVSMVGVVIAFLTNQPNKVQIIFRPLIVGLLVAVLLAIAQATTGIGLPEHLLNFRKDFFGYATIGFQPDLHAFAGHMLLGAIGLIGYLKILPKPSTERTIVQVTIALCWLGLVLSKSRALLLLALVTAAILVLYLIWKNNKSLFPKILIAGIGVLILLGWFVGHYSNSFNGIPVLAWLGELANEFKSRDLTSWSLFSGIFGSRFEIWEAAIRMWWEFPLLGTGQGTFYRYSAIPSFSKSHFLILNNGENAHNYFLQLLTENGLIGIAILGFAVIFPLLMVIYKEESKLVLYLILATALANVFSHSLLNRENLILLTVIVSLLYIINKQKIAREKNNSFNGKNLILSTVLISILPLYVLGYINSKNQNPIIFGYYCFIKKQLTHDRWSSGIYELSIPKHIEKLNINTFRPYVGKQSSKNEMKMTFQGLKNNEDGTYKILNSTTMAIDNIKIDNTPIKLELKNNNQYDAKNLLIILEKCYTPRNLGKNNDSRVLGINIKLIEQF